VSGTNACLLGVYIVDPSTSMNSDTTHSASANAYFYSTVLSWRP